MQPILVDMDNTIAKFDEEFDRRWQERYPNEIFIPAGDRKDFHIEKSYPKELQDKVVELFHEPGFFRCLEPMEDAIQVLLDLESKGHTIYLCTAPLTGAPGCMTEKYEWVQEVLGKRWVRKMIATDDKTAVKGTVLIDDKPGITGNFTPEWTQIFFDKPYNRNCGINRLIHWKYAESLLTTYCGIKVPNKYPHLV